MPVPAVTPLPAAVALDEPPADPPGAWDLADLEALLPSAGTDRLHPPALREQFSGWASV